MCDFSLRPPRKGREPHSCKASASPVVVMLGEESASAKRRTRAKTKEYKCDVIKRARVKNQRYVNWKGIIAEPKRHGEDCKCKRKCMSKVSEEDVDELYSTFISFNTKDDQDCYLQSLIEVHPIVRRRSRTDTHPDTKKPKSNSFRYNISPSSGKLNVCKVAFANIHGVTHDRVRRLCTLLSQGKEPEDLRGKSRPGNAIPKAHVTAIEEHISSFPTKQVHSTSRVYDYLSEKLNVKQMWQMFDALHPKKKIKYKFYLKIFQENFNLTFGKPDIEDCCECEEIS